MEPVRRRKILISNDDGVSAPGLRALVKELNRQSLYDIYICGPFGERSAQSHAISIGKVLTTFEIQVEGAVEAFAVDGTPADSIHVALRSPVLSVRTFDLVISGINRGDNAGIHVIYSGTVGAAREAAHCGQAAMSFSLNNHAARSEEQYEAAAKFAASLVKEYLTAVDDGADEIHKVVLNVNVPGDSSSIQGLRLCRQGRHTTTSDLVEVDSESDYIELNSHKDTSIHMGNVTLKSFRHHQFWHVPDDTPGTDYHELSQGWVTLTPLDSLMDVPLSPSDIHARYSENLLEQIRSITRSVSKSLGCPGLDHDGTQL